MNKKFLLPIFIMLGISLVAAIGYYAIFSATFKVLPAITLSTGCVSDLGNVHGGEVEEGGECIITNHAPSERIITLSDDSDENVSVSYLKSLNMEIKNSSWDTQSVGAILYYTVIGENFVYKTEEITSNLTDYVVVYYPDDEGNPGPWNIGSAIVIGDVSDEVVVSENVTENLPIGEDFNDKAKLWLMPLSDVNEPWSNSMLNRILFEHDLITYTKGDSGTIVIPSEESVTLIPTYVIADYATGTYTITTTVA